MTMTPETAPSMTADQIFAYRIHGKVPPDDTQFNLDGTPVWIRREYHKGDCYQVSLVDKTGRIVDSARVKSTIAPWDETSINKAARSAWRKMPNHLRRSFELADLVSIGTLAVLESADQSDAYIRAYHAILKAWRTDSRRGSASQVELTEHDAPCGSRNHRLADIDLALRSVPSDVAETAYRVLAGETAREIGFGPYKRMERALQRTFA